MTLIQSSGIRQAVSRQAFGPQKSFALFDVCRLALVGFLAIPVGVSVANAQSRPAGGGVAASAPTPNAVPLPEVGARFSLNSPTKDGGSYNISKSSGKRVMVLYWSTDCAICKTKMPDIRRELTKASGKFDVVLVNTDRQWSTAEAYERVLQSTERNAAGAGAARAVRIWRGDAGFSDSVGAAVPTANRSPLALLIDARGVVTKVISGRYDDSVWAELNAK
jgi:hypothetical protein